MSLTTPRLLLRRWRDSDREPMAQINRDPEVTRFLNRPPSPYSFFDNAVAHWDAHGFGFYAVESREPATEGVLLGFVGVAHPHFLPELADQHELGWRLARAAWGRGYATEAAQAARDHAFETLDLPGLISIIHPGNVRSQRVAAKVGMIAAESVYIPVIEHSADVWRLSRPS